MKQLFIIGGSSSAIFLSLLLIKEKCDLKINIIEKNKILGRKLLATGNGRCNLLNNKIDEFSFNNEYTKNLCLENIINFEINFFEELGIKLTSIGDLIYPNSFSAKSFTDYLIRILKNNNVNFITETTFLDYQKNDNKYKIVTDKINFIADAIVFACGGKSYPNLGSDGRIFDILKKHNYKIKNLKPGLSPIKTVEKVKEIENERIKCLVSLFVNNKLIYQEDGEVLFKKDGISGICILNISSLIQRNNYYRPEISLNLLTNITLKEFLNFYNVSKENLLYGLFSERLALFLNKEIEKIFKNKINKNNIKQVYSYLSDFRLTYLTSYDFKDSQVSLGGVEFSNLTENLESKNERKIYFIGEMLDSDGLCGGYNLMIAFSSALKVFNKLKEHL